jgi:hypothetical protein
MEDKKVIQKVHFCPEDDRHRGAVEVLELTVEGKRTIGMRLTVGHRSVPLPRNRISEVIEALQKGAEEASAAYMNIIEELNQ